MPRRNRRGAAAFRPWCPRCGKWRTTTTVDYHVKGEPRCRTCRTGVEWRPPPSPLRRPRKVVKGQQRML
jgi:uncharacterized protein (DUF983 family)